MTTPFLHAALGLCSAISLAALAAPQAVVIYGDDGYPPYSYVEHGKLTGIYTDIV